MPIKKTRSNPNLKKNETQYNLLDQIKPSAHKDYYSLPDLYRFNNELNEAMWNSLIIDAVRNLNYKFLRTPIIFKNYLIRDIMNVMLNCQFSEKVVKEGYEYIRKFSSITFKTILDKITKKNHPLIEELIIEHLDIFCDVNNFTIIWPLHLILIIVEKDLESSIKSNWIISVYNKYVNITENEPLERCPVLRREDYDALKKQTVHLYQSEQYLWSKIFPGTDIIVSEIIVESVNPSFGYKLLKYKINYNTTNQTSLKGLCRNKIRTIMQKFNINHTLESFKIPKCLVDYLMYINIKTATIY